MFIYIAAADIIPDIHERPHNEGRIQSVLLVVGVLVIGGIALLLPHDHNHGHEHEGRSIVPTNSTVA